MGGQEESETLRLESDTSYGSDVSWEHGWVGMGSGNGTIGECCQKLSRASGRAADSVPRKVPSSGPRRLDPDSDDADDESAFSNGSTDAQRYDGA
jgi:hypothetical protein